MYYLVSSAALLILSAATLFKQNLKIKDLNQSITTLKVQEEEAINLKQLNIDYKSLLISTYCPKIYVSVDSNYVLHVEFYSLGWENLFDKTLLAQHKEFFNELTEIVSNDWKTNILQVYRTGVPIGPVRDNLLVCLPNNTVKEFNVVYYASKDRLGKDTLIKLHIIDETEIANSIKLSKEKEELARVLLQMTTHQIKNKARTLSLVLEELETREEKVRDVNKLLDRRKCRQDDDLINEYSKLVQLVIDTNVVSSLKQKTKEILNLTEYIAKLCHQNLVAIEDTIINLNALVARACREISFPLEQIEYNLEYCIKGDKNLLTEVFIEILSNSKKYADPNRILFVKIISKETIVCGEKALLISIQDNGIGIPTNKLSSVIEPYVRLNKHIEGTGLGLTFVKQILRRHNAELTLVHGVNKGLCVELLFKGGFLKKGVNCNE